jgi:VanZ like family
VVVKGTFLPCPFGTTGTFGDPWRDYINLTPLQNTDFWDDMVENALLFIPVGVLLPLLTRVRAIWLTTLIGSLISLGIETGQFITDVTLHAGHVADINDWMFNTLGVLIGSLLLTLVMQIPAAARLVARMAGRGTQTGLAARRIGGAAIAHRLAMDRPVDRCARVRGARRVRTAGEGQHHHSSDDRTQGENRGQPSPSPPVSSSSGALYAPPLQRLVVHEGLQTHF